MAVPEHVRQRLTKTASTPAEKCRKRFLRFFPRGFYDPKYVAWERAYKQKAHEQWQERLNQKSYRKLLKDRQFTEIAATAISIESRTNLLFSFEKMALRDAVRESEGAETFATGLYSLLYGKGSMAARFEKWCEAVASLPHKKTRVFTHPVVTVFPFIAEPNEHIVLKPNLTKRAAADYGFEFRYNSKPSWEVYSQLLRFAETIKRDNADMRPRDMIDIQSFIWTIASDEYRSIMA